MSNSAVISESIRNIDLPIQKELGNLVRQLSTQNNLVLQAEPGAGKTSLVPLVLLESITAGKKILVLEPRRLAAKNAAQRMAEIIDQPVGQLVGYRIRNQNKTSSKTRIEVITEGILTRMLLDDPELADIGLIIFDEFHERSIDADLGLAFSLEVQQSLREDLKILVMSATLDSQPIAELMNRCPVIESKGRSFPVETAYMPSKLQRDWRHSIVNAVIKGLNQSRRDLLVFLPGKAEIMQADKLLRPLLSAELDSDNGLILKMLYGELSFAEQVAAIKPIAGKRKIILATNIAESSLTIDGVDCVIDSGLEKINVFDPNVGFDHLQLQKISNASAIQRAGRAGRLGPGFCIRLWSSSDILRDHTPAEIQRVDLSRFCLDMASWGVQTVEQLALLEKPKSGMLNQAQELLRTMSALNRKGVITPHGRQLASLPCHPRLGQMLLRAGPMGVTEFAALTAAALEENIQSLPQLREQIDFGEQLLVIQRLPQGHRLKINLNKQVRRLLNSLRPLNKTNASYPQLREAESQQYLPVLCALAFPDRVGMRRGSGYLFANGTGLSVDPLFPIQSDFIVAIKLGGQSGRRKIYQAIALERETIEEAFSDQIQSRETVTWDAQKNQMNALRQRCLGHLILDSRPIGNPDPELIAQGLIEAIRRLGLSSLPWNKKLLQWRARVNRLAALEPFQSEFPDMNDGKLLDELESWLKPFLSGIDRLSKITPDLLDNALKSVLDWNAQQRLATLVPETIKVASGSQIKLDYSGGELPVLAVKLQEMFGEKQSPVLAQGHLPVVIHLLSPAQRPLQITKDLASFWQNAYPEVQKEMKGRYPKHPWPDDPLTAVATRLTKSKIRKA